LEISIFRFDLEPFFIKNLIFGIEAYQKEGIYRNGGKKVIGFLGMKTTIDTKNFMNSSSMKIFIEK